MKLSHVTLFEINEWGIASGEYKGIDFSITKDRYGYSGSLSIMFAENGEHDGAINICVEKEETLSELKAAIKNAVSDFLSPLNVSVNELREEARKVDFGNDSWDNFQEFYQKSSQSKKLKLVK